MRAHATTMHKARKKFIPTLLPGTCKNFEFFFLISKPCLTTTITRPRTYFSFLNSMQKNLVLLLANKRARSSMPVISFCELFSFLPTNETILRNSISVNGSNIIERLTSHRKPIWFESLFLLVKAFFSLFFFPNHDWSHL